MAGVRATTGTAVQRTNCHPFRHQNWLFQHNGAIREFSRVKRKSCSPFAPACFAKSRAARMGIMFHLALTFGLQDDPVAGVEKMIGFVEEVGHSHGVTHPMQMTLAVLDGRTLAFRYSSEGNSRTLFHSADVATLRNGFTEHAPVTDDTRAVVSEPLGDIENAGEAWVEIPGVERRGRQRRKGGYPQAPAADARTDRMRRPSKKTKQRAIRMKKMNRDNTDRSGVSGSGMAGSGTCRRATGRRNARRQDRHPDHRLRPRRRL